MVAAVFELADTSSQRTAQFESYNCAVPSPRAMSTNCGARTQFARCAQHLRCTSAAHAKPSQLPICDTQNTSRSNSWCWAMSS